MKILVIDEDFRKKSGHFYQYNKFLISIFKSKKIPIEVFASKLIEKDILYEIPEIYPFFQSFRRLSYLPVLGDLISKLIFWQDLYRKLLLLDKEKGHEMPFYFFEMVTINNLFPIALFLLKKKRPSSVILRTSLISLSGYPELVQVFLRKVQFKLISRLIKMNTIFFTDSEVVQSEFERIFSSKIYVLPIPIIHNQEAIKTRDKNGSFFMYLPGVIRKDKGVEFIIEAMTELGNLYPEVLKKITLISQYQSKYEEDYCEQIKIRLNSLKLKNLFLGDLSSEEFESMFNKSDLILVVYNPNYGYGARTSGILGDSIYYEKPFITTKNTWMSIQADKYNTGISVDYGNSRELMNSILEIINNYTTYECKAKNASQKWKEFHSRDRYAELLFKSMIKSD